MRDLQMWGSSLRIVLLRISHRYECILARKIAWHRCINPLYQGFQILSEEVGPYKNRFFIGLNLLEFFIVKCEFFKSPPRFICQMVWLVKIWITREYLIQVKKNQKKKRKHSTTWVWWLYHYHVCLYVRDDETSTELVILAVRLLPNGNPPLHILQFSKF